jgi:hypothetical protein
VIHECSLSGFMGGELVGDVFHCAHGYPMPAGSVIRTRYGSYVVGETEPPPEPTLRLTVQPMKPSP